MIIGRLRALSVLFYGLALILAPTWALAAETQVAVAANFTEPAKEIAAVFKAQTGHTAVLSFGSSGQFYAQMSHGAPYEVFLSADADRPEKAEQEGLGVAGSRFTYARGRLVLFSKSPGLVDSAGAVIASGKFEKLAIADPAAAPYGLAAVQTLQKLGLYTGVKPKIVMGSSITQAFQFVDTGSAELGFVAYSQVINVLGGSRWVVPETYHAPIDQQAILLVPGRDKPAAKAFLSFLKGQQAKAIIRKFGYEAP